MNSFTTSTDRPRGIIRRQLDRLVVRMCTCKESACQRRLRHRRSRKRLIKSRTQRQLQNQEKETAAKLLTLWKPGRTAWVASAASSTGDTGAAGETAVLPTPPRFIERQLNFLCCHVDLPTTRQLRPSPPSAEDGDDDGLKATSVPGLSRTGLLQLVTRFQARVRAHQRRRRLLRAIEFTAWLKDCRDWRFQLAIINGVFAGAVALCALTVCVMLSAAFTAEECVQWVVEVVKSLLVQLFVLDPLLGVLVLGSQLLVGWLLLRLNKGHGDDATTDGLTAKAASLVSIWALCTSLPSAFLERCVT